MTGVNNDLCSEVARKDTWRRHWLTDSFIFPDMTSSDFIHDWMFRFVDSGGGPEIAETAFIGGL